MKIKITLALFISIVSCQFSFGQDLTTDIYGKRMEDMLAVENKLGGKLFQTDGDIVVAKGMAMPLTYRRIERNIPDLLVTYTLTEKDSLISRIEYEWDAINFDKNGGKQPLEVQQAFIKKYKLLENELTKIYGKSVQKDELKDLSQIDLKGGLKQRNDWKPNDSLEVNLYAVFSNYQEKKGEVEIRPTNRIRIYVNKTNPKLGDKSVQLAKKNFDQFIENLRTGNLKVAQTFISLPIRNQISEDALNELRGTIKSGSFRVYSKTIQPTNGNEYLMIQFAYEDVVGEPKEIIKVFFDQSNMIIGLQPLVRK